MSQPGPSRRWVWMWSSQAWGHRRSHQAMSTPMCWSKRPRSLQIPWMDSKNWIVGHIPRYIAWTLPIANKSRKLLQVVRWHHLRHGTSLPEQIQDALASWVGTAVRSIGHQSVDLMILFRCMWWASKKRDKWGESLASKVNGGHVSACMQMYLLYLCVCVCLFFVNMKHICRVRMAIFQMCAVHWRMSSFPLPRSILCCTHPHYKLLIPSHWQSNMAMEYLWISTI